MTAIKNVISNKYLNNVPNILIQENYNTFNKY